MGKTATKAARRPIHRPRRPKPAADSFAARLCQLRKAKGYTQGELGEAVGLTTRMVNFYERESGNPPASLLIGFAEALGVTVEELLGLRGVAAKREAPPENLRLWRKLRQVEKLPPKARKAVLDHIEALAAQYKSKAS